MSRLLFISFIDFGDFHSGSSVRPQRMYDAFRELGYEITLLSGLQNRRCDRTRRVCSVMRQIRRQPPDFCYVEPPSGPFFNLCDHLLLLRLARMGVPVGLFYRDAYWKFADWWQVKGIKRAVLTFMQRFDLRIFKKTCKIVYFPTAAMAELFDLPRKGLLPPAGTQGKIGPRAENPAVPDCVNALYIGGVSRFYGTDILLKAFEIVNERMQKPVHLTVVCREAEMGSFFDSYKEKPWLTIAHASGDEALAPHYARSDFALYPSRRDFYMDFCMPVKLFEYLSRALPVVCTDCREAAAFVRENGIGLVTKDTPEAFALAVARLCEEPGLLGRLRRQCETALVQNNLWIHRARQVARDLWEET